MAGRRRVRPGVHPPVRRTRNLETSALQRIKKGAEDFVATQFREGNLGGVIVQGEFSGELDDGQEFDPVGDSSRQAGDRFP